MKDEETTPEGMTMSTKAKQKFVPFHLRSGIGKEGVARLTHEEFMARLEAIRRGPLEEYDGPEIGVPLCEGEMDRLFRRWTAQRAEENGGQVPLREVEAAPPPKPAEDPEFNRLFAGLHLHLADR